MKSPILRATVRIVFFIQLFFSIYLLFHGHNYPGGGFIGGLVAAAAFTIFEIGTGKKMALFGLHIRPLNLIFVGLALSLASGYWGAIVHTSFLEAVWGPGIELPILGSIKSGSVLFFDIGVYLLVAGMTTELVYTLGDESIWNS